MAEPATETKAAAPATPAPAPAAETKPTPPPAAPPPAAPAAETKPETKPSDETKKLGKKDEPAKPKAPEKYELKAPKDAMLDAKALERIEADARKRGLSQEDAQAEVERHAAAVKSYVDEQVQAWHQRAAQWKAEIAKDAEFGGAKLAEAAEAGKRFLAKYGDPALIQELEETGYGNYPALFKAFARAGLAMANDKLVQGPGLPASAKKKPEEILYNGA